MSTEESPLLGDQLQPNTHTPHGAVPTEDVYDRFDRGQKRVILAIASITGLLPSVSCILIRLFFFRVEMVRSVFVSGCFVPSIPQISTDLHSTPAAVRYVWHLHCRFA